MTELDALPHRGRQRQRHPETSSTPQAALEETATPSKLQGVPLQRHKSTALLNQSKARLPGLGLSVFPRASLGADVRRVGHGIPRERNAERERERETEGNDYKGSEWHISVPSEKEYGRRHRSLQPKLRERLQRVRFRACSLRTSLSEQI